MKTQNATIMALATMLTKANSALAAAASNGERYSPALGREVEKKAVAAAALETLGVAVTDPYPGMAVTARDGTQCRVIYTGIDGTVLVEATYAARTWSGDVISFSEEFTEAQLPEGCEH